MTKRAEPVRTCVGCRTRAAKSDLLRVVMAAGSAGVLIPDLRGRMPGRGAHLHPDQECLALAERRRAFGRALRHDGPIDVAPVREQVRQHRDLHDQSRTHDHSSTTSPVAERADHDDERSMSQHR